MMLKITPCELKDANEFIERYHRHHKKVQGHRFSIAALDTETQSIVAVAVVGRPVARAFDHHQVLEVTRMCSDGTKNACSFLYSAAARIGKLLGYSKIQTYILESELGTSLKASGWVNEGKAGGTSWRHKGRPNRRIDQPQGPKQRWAKILND